MNTHETYKGYTLRVRNDNGGFNGRIHKNGILVFDTWRPTEELAQADMKKWVDREISPMVVRTSSRMFKAQQRLQEVDEGLCPSCNQPLDGTDLACMNSDCSQYGPRLVWESYGGGPEEIINGVTV